MTTENVKVKCLINKFSQFYTGGNVVTALREHGTCESNYHDPHFTVYVENGQVYHGCGYNKGTINGLTLTEEECATLEIIRHTKLDE
ncbi:MAG: hypothetical protein ACXAB7_23190 [Candidatus Kariarchaeaceae archaeon]|jgi:hypothetical protein